MSEWKEYKIGELVEKATSGGTPSTKIDEYYNGHIPWLNTKEVNFNRIWKTEKNISEKGLLNSSAKWIEKNSVIVAMYGATAAKVAINKIPLTTNQACCNLTIDQTKANYEFVFYCIWNKYDELKNIAVGAAQQNLSVSAITDFTISIPPLSEQKSIASVLSSLDDKIDLLHHQNATLEKMAETLFRQWFVEEAEDEWEEKPLSSIANFLNGLACQKFLPKNDIEKLPVLKIKELREGITENSDWATTDVEPEYIVKNGDVIFAWSASLMVKIWNGQDCILNQHLFKVTSDDYPKWFYFLWCKYHLDEFIAIAASHATTMGHIKRRDLDEAIVLVPSTNELEEMNSIADPLINKIIENNKQIRSLTALRNTLLPKLMSGEVRVEN